MALSNAQIALVAALILIVVEMVMNNPVVRSATFGLVMYALLKGHGNG